MTRPEFQALLTEIRSAQDKLLTEKGADYTQQSDDVHHNFKIVAEQVGTECEHCHKHTKLSPLAVWGVYATKHWLAIMTYIKYGAVASEPIESRFRDQGNYLLLGEGLLPPIPSDKLTAKSDHRIGCWYCGDEHTLAQFVNRLCPKRPT